MKIFYEFTKNCTKEIKQCGIESNGGCTCNRALHMQLVLRYFTAYEDTIDIFKNKSQDYSLRLVIFGLS